MINYRSRQSPNGGRPINSLIMISNHLGQRTSLESLRQFLVSSKLENLKLRWPLQLKNPSRRFHFGNSSWNGFLTRDCLFEWKTIRLSILISIIDWTAFGLSTGWSENWWNLFTVLWTCRNEFHYWFWKFKELSVWSRKFGIRITTVPLQTDTLLVQRNFKIEKILIASTGSFKQWGDCKWSLIEWLQ